jgi:hypothetical protein
MNRITQKTLAELTPQQKRDLLRSMLSEKSRVSDEFPLSRHQLGLWVLVRLAPESASYNTALAVRASPALDSDALSRALEKIIHRHPALRTVFLERDGVPMQRVCEKGATLRIINLDGADDETLKQSVIQDYRVPFDLQVSPMRATLFRLNDSDLVMLNMHHIVFDAWSANILYRDLAALYQQELRGMPAALAPASATYRSFVDWQSGMLESEEGRSHWGYWSERLKDNPPDLDLPFRKKATKVPSFTGTTIPLTIRGMVYQRLKALAISEQVTVFSVLATVYSIMLHRLSGQPEIIVGVAVSGRTQQQWAGIIGDFINMLPLRLFFSPDLRFEHHLQNVSTEIRNALAHQDFPFPLMVERLRMRRDSGYSPIFQAMINMHVARAGTELSRLFDNSAMPFGDSLLQPYPIPQQEGQYDLALELLDTGDEMVGGLRYATDAFDDSTAGQLGQQFLSLVNQITGNPRRQLDEFRIDPPGGTASTELFVI